MAQSQAPINIMELLDGVEFPATLVDLVEYAQENEASEEALDLIQAMPDRTYNSMKEISRNLNLVEDLPGHENLWPSEPSEDVPGVSRSN